MVLLFHNKRKSVDYYRNDDETEYTKVEFDEGKDIFFGFSMIFTK